MKYINKIILFCFSFIVFSLTCLADDIDFDLYVDNTTLEPGQIVNVSVLLDKISDDMEINDLTVGLNFNDDIFEYVKEDTNYLNLEDFELIMTYKVVDGILFRMTSENNTITKDLNKTDILKNIKLRIKDVDNQTAKIWVTDEFNLKQKSVSVNIYKKDSDSTLSSLSVSGFDLEPKFDKTITTYTLSVPYEKNSILINAKCESRNCKIEGNKEQNLEVGKNLFEVIVTSENENKTTYNLEVTRLGASNDNTLSSLELKDSNNEVIDIGFNSSKTSYNINLKNDIIYVTYDSECSGVNCSIDNSRGTKKLEVGNNNIKIKVISEDKVEKTYSININREEIIKEKNYSIILYLVLVFVIGLVLLYILLRNYKNSKEIEDILDDDENE